MRTQIAAGNWKMNLTADDAKALTSEIIHMVRDEYQGEAEMILTPPYPFLSMVGHLIQDEARIHLAAQNLHQEVKGAYTGEVAAAMLTSVGVTHVLIGHSERRRYFEESNELLAQKTKQALSAGLVPIFCIGETLEEREAGKVFDVNQQQLTEGLFHLTEAEFQPVIIAYEPVWAIGTGKTATPEQAQEVHQFIRKLVAETYSSAAADATTILYGGSVKPANAHELFAQPDIDGGLVGGASLKSRDFTEILKAL